MDIFELDDEINKQLALEGYTAVEEIVDSLCLSMISLVKLNNEKYDDVMSFMGKALNEKYEKYDKLTREELMVVLINDTLAGLAEDILQEEK